MSHITDFTQSEAKIVVDLINYDNGTYLTGQDISFGNPTEQNGAGIKLRVNSVPGSGYGEGVDVNYTRLNIQEFMDLYLPDGITIQQGDATETVDFLDEINTALGTAIPASSVQSTPITGWSGAPNEILPLPFYIAQSSKVYYGNAIIKVDGNDIAISSLISKHLLSGLHFPGFEGSVDIQPTIDAIPYPLSADIGTTAEAAIQRLRTRLGATAKDIAFRLPSPVMPSREASVVSIEVVSPSGKYNFGGEEVGRAKYGLGRFEIPDESFTEYLVDPSAWLFAEPRGWYRNLPLSNTSVIDSMKYLPAMVNRLKRFSGLFTSHNGNPAMGYVMLDFLQGDVAKSVGFADTSGNSGRTNRYNDGQLQSITTGTEHNANPLIATYGPPGTRSDVTDVKINGYYVTGQPPTIRGMRKFVFEFYVSE